MTLSARSAIMGVLWLQVAIGVLLFTGNVWQRLPTLFTGTPDAPPLTQPTSPGDQTRRYSPAGWPDRPAPPNRPYQAPANMPSRLAFDVIPAEGGQALTITGQIESGDAARFEDWRAERDLPNRVFLNSPGGSVSDALAIGRILRDASVQTEVTAGDICLSACPYMFAAGTVRRAHRDGAIGVHQHFYGENTLLPAFVAVEDIQRGQGRVLDFLDDMGIDLRLMSHSLATPPDEIYILTAAELTEYALATEILPGGS
ncbi:hypothetical protein ACP2AV_13385 [Aliiroseovarius sp. PTFE2010]|uniref:COG3904 family protein n=1 Tax=Aliiroseovarius sp. PTFE2010 TaxID=3417190 RepID=UPI003CF21CE4